MKRKRVATYCRVDSGGDSKSRRASLDFQYRKVERCTRRHQMKIVASYEDDGYSGHDLTRPGLQQMIADYQTGKFDAVLTPSFDRLFRGATLEQPDWPFPVYAADFIEWTIER